MAGIDCAVGPTLEQMRAAQAAGALWVGWYLPGGSQFHAWTRAELAVLDAAQVPASMPIYVPRMIGGRIDPAAVPELDAARAVWIAHAAGWQGTVALDTEASMRGDPWTHEYEARFGDEVNACGHPWRACTYAGGFTFSTPPKHPPWWIWHGSAPAGQCYQNGQVNYLGLWVDTDSAGDGFPLATRTR